MTYTYKLGNNGPIAEVGDDIKITKEGHKEGGKGFFGGAEEWSLHYLTPGSSGATRVSRGTRTSYLGGSKIEYKW